MDEQKPQVLKHAFNWGLLVGAILILYNVIIYFLGKNLEGWVEWLSLVILIGGIYYSAKKYRDKVLDGEISYGRALGFSVLVVLFSSLVSAIYNYVLMKYIDPEIISNIVINSEEELINSGISDDKIEKSMELAKKFITPGLLTLFALPFSVFFGFLISLITSIFIKKGDQSSPFKA